MRLHEPFETPFHTAEEKLEVVTRSLVRRGFGELLGVSEANLNIQSLERVLFDTIYPCPDR